MALDIVVLLDGTSRTMRYFDSLKNRLPHAKKLVTQSKGVQAYKEAARVANTSSFFVVDHNFYINSGYDFSFVPDEYEKNYTHVWRHQTIAENQYVEYNPGYNGVFMFSKASLRTDASDLNDIGDGVKYVDEIISREIPLDVIVLSYKNPYVDRNQKVVESYGIQAKRVDCEDLFDGYLKAAQIAETDAFFVVDADFKIAEPSFRFRPHNYDAKYFHMWPSINADYSGLKLAHKDMFIGKTKEDFEGADFKYTFGPLDAITKHMILGWQCVKEPQSYDLVFLSYDEPNAEENWIKLSSKYPHAKRVHGVVGILNAHKKAAQISTPNNFYVIDGDSLIVDDFDFDIQLDEYDAKNYVHIWKCLNPVNGLEYGYGGLKLFNKDMFMAIDETLVDMSTILGSGVKLMDKVASVTHFNSDETRAFRSAFRECTKLASGIIKNQVDEESKRRLDTWLTVGEGPFADYVLLGARHGKEFGEANADDVNMLTKINDFKWLNNYLRAEKMNKIENDLLYAKYDKIDTRMIINLTNLLYDPSIKLELNEIRDCLSRGQLVSKLWLIDELNNLNLTQDLTMLILGGWIGSLSSLMFQNYKDQSKIKRIISSDVDPRCEKIADLLNIEKVIDGWRFKAITGDMMDFDYTNTIGQVRNGDTYQDLGIDWNVLVNTCCEHLYDVPAWFAMIPEGKLVVAQSNNYFACDQHSSSVASLEKFKEQCPFSKVLYEGVLPFELYDRYMIIGIK